MGNSSLVATSACATSPRTHGVSQYTDASRFLHEPRNMSFVRGVTDDESSKPYRRLPISSPNDAATHGMKNNGPGDGGTVSEVLSVDDKSYKDACTAASEALYAKREWGKL
ncbi:hypothetical protein U9M48_015783 [Paspalum notatum var. saurae]|uniref:Uncharacterized protein n=1 Tax=Paspalum notatum var. saurae TaxID=547442 RepID=A0AAQ3T7J6_PASNO